MLQCIKEYSTEQWIIYRDDWLGPWDCTRWLEVIPLVRGKHHRGRVSIPDRGGGRGPFTWPGPRVLHGLEGAGVIRLRKRTGLSGNRDILLPSLVFSVYFKSSKFKYPVSMKLEYTCSSAMKYNVCPLHIYYKWQIFSNCMCTKIFVILSFRKGLASAIGLPCVKWVKFKSQIRMLSFPVLWVLIITNPSFYTPLIFWNPFRKL